MIKSTTAFIVEDEPRSRKVLEKYLASYCPQIELIGSASNAKEALVFIKKHRPQILLLDIEISSEDSPENSFDLISKVPDYPYKVVFITAFSHYALKAIKFHALAYLLKPINITELEDAMSLAVKQIEQNQKNLHLQDFLHRLEQPERNRPRIWIPNSEGMTSIYVDEIIRLEASGRCTFLFNSKGHRIFSSRNLKEYINMLEPYRFFQVHRSHLINIDHIQKFINSDGGEVIMSDHSRVPVSRRRKQTFLNNLKGTDQP